MQAGTNTARQCNECPERAFLVMSVGMLGCCPCKHPPLLPPSPSNFFSSPGST